MNFTKSIKANEIRRKWHLIDVKDKVLGRISSEIAKLLMGKYKNNRTLNLDCGDYVVVVNSLNVKVTGNKSTQKIYMRYSGYPGGENRKPYVQVLREDPKRIIFEAVSGMLPNNKLRASMMKRLYVFTDNNHTYKDKFKIN